MNTGRNTLRLGAATLALMLAGPTAIAQDTIKLGLTAALTGPFNEFGEGIRRGAVLAIEEWNRNGGVDGKQIELAEALDDQLSPDRAVQNMRRILDNEDIVGIIAPAGSGPTLATIDMLEADGRPVCNPMAQAPQIVYPNGMDQPPRKMYFRWRSRMKPNRPDLANCWLKSTSMLAYFTKVRPMVSRAPTSLSVPMPLACRTVRLMRSPTTSAART